MIISYTVTSESSSGVTNNWVAVFLIRSYGAPNGTGSCSVMVTLVALSDVGS